MLINKSWDIASSLIVICNYSLLNLNTPSFHFPNVIVSWVPSSMSNQQPKEFSLTTYKIEFLFQKHLRSYFLMKNKVFDLLFDDLVPTTTFHSDFSGVFILNPKVTCFRGEMRVFCCIIAYHSWITFRIITLQATRDSFHIV